MAPARDDAESYFISLAPSSAGVLAELEEQAEKVGIPIVGPVVGRLLTLLCRTCNAKRVLELGAATGYSAIHLAAGLSEDGCLVTVEMAPDMAAAARENLARAGFAETAEVREGEAMAVMEQMSGPFDLVFLDMEKDRYAPALAPIKRLLRPGGLLVADNTAFADAEDFNAKLHADADFLTVSLFCLLPGHSPERDGMALAVRL